MKQLYCSIFGHDYHISKEVTYHVKEYACKHCKEQVTTNASSKLTLLTPKHKEINDVLEHIHSNRLKRKAIILGR
ncbi:MAG: hypothetical protein ACI93P_002492 [bacterium]